MQSMTLIFAVGRPKATISLYIGNWFIHWYIARGGRHLIHVGLAQAQTQPLPEVNLKKKRRWLNDGGRRVGGHCH